MGNRLLQRSKLQRIPSFCHRLGVTTEGISHIPNGSKWDATDTIDHKTNYRSADGKFSRLSSFAFVKLKPQKPSLTLRGLEFGLICRHQRLFARMSYGLTLPVCSSVAITKGPYGDWEASAKPLYSDFFVSESLAGGALYTANTPMSRQPPPLLCSSAEEMLDLMRTVALQLNLEREKHALCSQDAVETPSASGSTFLQRQPVQAAGRSLLPDGPRVVTLHYVVEVTPPCWALKRRSRGSSSGVHVYISTRAEGTVDTKP
ncbi:hypothetical protein EYF80_036899 [Liparis tanakae]|uniref:Uncharacterized protein n=1 Tax=Liparis tanakae TaxID=230148 RepID=A0A4Z2GHF9_9TELE|nr:hypothetical protein EYF80_036899 [Liparis tanakae]